MISPIKNKTPNSAKIGSPGDFGYKRSFYYPGIDIYCDEGTEIVAMEAGQIVNIDIFTGPNADPKSPWWNETFSIIVEGSNGCIGYCEILPKAKLKIGDKVYAGEIIGTIISVLKKEKIIGLGTSMLHLEFYQESTTQHVTWHLDKEKPIELLNPRILLENIDEFETIAQIQDYFTNCIICGKNMNIYLKDKFSREKSLLQIKENIFYLSKKDVYKSIYDDNINYNKGDNKFSFIHKKCKTCMFVVEFNSFGDNLYKLDSVEFEIHINKNKYYYVQYNKKSSLFINGAYVTNFELDLKLIQNFSHLKRRLKTISTFA